MNYKIKYMDTNKGFIGIMGVVFLAIVLFIGFPVALSMFSLDWTVGEHGRLTVTAVDRNLFGTHTVYVRNSESLSGNEQLEVKYCIDSDDQQLVDLAKSSIGKQNTTLVYSEKRIGFFWYDKCNGAPITKINLSE